MSRSKTAKTCKKAGRDAGDRRPVIRRFGNLENYEYHLIESRLCAMTLVSCRYLVPAGLAAPEKRGQLTSHIEEAIARIVIENACLRSGIVDADSKRPSWVGIDSLAFDNHIEWRQLDAADFAHQETYRDMFQKLVEKRLDDVFPRDTIGTVPRWRVLGLLGLPQDGAAGQKPFVEILFDYHHALCDGMSGKFFHEKLLHNLNDTLSDSLLSKDRILVVPPTSPALAPPQEKLMKFGVSPKFALSEAWKSMLRPASWDNSRALARWNPIRASPADYGNSMRTFDIDGSTIGNVLKACRAHGTTLTGLFHALFLVTLSTQLSASDAQAFVGSTALDTRRHFSPADRVKAAAEDPSRIMGNLVAIMTHKFRSNLVEQIRGVSTSSSSELAAAATTTTAPESTQRGPLSGYPSPPSPELASMVWQAASQARGDIQKRLDLGTRDNIVGLMDLVPDWRALFKEEAGKPRAQSWCITNIGVFDGNNTTSPEKNATAVGGAGRGDGSDVATKEPWTVDHAFFGVCHETIGAPFTLAAVSTLGGRLCVCVCWQACGVETKIGEAVVKSIERWLLFLGEDSR